MSRGAGGGVEGGRGGIREVPGSGLRKKGAWHQLPAQGSQGEQAGRACMCVGTVRGGGHRQRKQLEQGTER